MYVMCRILAQLSVVLVELYDPKFEGICQRTILRMLSPVSHSFVELLFANACKQNWFLYFSVGKILNAMPKAIIDCGIELVLSVSFNQTV